MRDMLQKNNPGAKIESTTLPKPGTRGIKHAGKRHPESGVVYDNRGLPIFDGITKYETHIPHKDFFPQSGRGKNLADLRSSHMRQATRQLRADIKAEVVDRNMFTGEQLRAIRSGEAQIPGYTWEHAPQPGRMKLVDAEKHSETPHIGSIALHNKKQGESLKK